MLGAASRSEVQIFASLELVSQERKEGRHDDGDAGSVHLFAPHRGQLVHHALAETRRECREAVASLLQRSNGVQLCNFEGCSRAEPGPEYGLQFLPERAHLYFVLMPVATTALCAPSRIAVPIAPITGHLYCGYGLRIRQVGSVF